MPEYRPVTDTEWNWLQRRFAALDFMPNMREKFDRSLPGSPYTPAERRVYRREIFQAVREMMAPTEAYPNPYFELTWFRNAEDNPALRENVAHNRSVLWRAFFMPQEPPGARERAEEEWRRLVPDEQDLVVTTDGESEPSE